MKIISIRKISEYDSYYKSYNKNLRQTVKNKCSLKKNYKKEKLGTCKEDNSSINISL